MVRAANSAETGLRVELGVSTNHTLLVFRMPLQARQLLQSAMSSSLSGMPLKKSVSNGATEPTQYQSEQHRARMHDTHTWRMCTNQQFTQLIHT